MTDWLDLPEMVLDQSNRSGFPNAGDLGVFLIRRPPSWARAAEAARRFFSLSDAAKLHSMAGSGTLGYRPVGVENLAVDAGESDDAPADRNESFAATWEDTTGGDRRFTWPELSGFREGWASFHRCHIGSPLRSETGSFPCSRLREPLCTDQDDSSPGLDCHTAQTGVDSHTRAIDVCE